jgi:Ser/Thr protein kinase RdoA (MazF antagonist)
LIDAMTFWCAGYRDYRELPANEQEAWDMLEAGERLRTALADKGIAPR